MRKVLWLGSFLVMACAMGAYGIAQYAAQHPSAAVTHCVNIARMGMGVVPTSDSHPAPTNKSDNCNSEPVCPGKNNGPECELNKEVVLVSTAKPANPMATDPLEVIQIEQIDPKVASAIAGAIGLEENLKQFKVAQVCEDKGLDQVVVQVMDENGVRECRGQERFPRHFMPYCEDADGDAISCQMPGEHYCARSCPTHCLRMPTAEETEALFMPYAEEQSPSSEVVEEQAEETTESAEMPEEMPASEETLPIQDPSYHHPHQGCPYPHGHYCPYPYSSRPYYHQPRTEPQDDSEMQQERRNPNTTNRISNWYGTNTQSPTGQNRGERVPIDWDRHDDLAFPQQFPSS